MPKFRFASPVGVGPFGALRKLPGWCVPCRFKPPKTKNPPASCFVGGGSSGAVRRLGCYIFFAPGDTHTHEQQLQTEVYLCAK
jgi:hypothetical protein